MKIDVTNLIYGDEMRGMKGFRVVVEPLIPELEKDGLCREEVLQELTAKIEKLKGYEVGSFRVENLFLFKSDLRPTGAVYTKLRAFNLEFGV